MFISIYFYYVGPLLAFLSFILNLTGIVFLRKVKPFNRERSSIYLAAISLAICFGNLASVVLSIIQFSGVYNYYTCMFTELISSILNAVFIWLVAMVLVDRLVATVAIKQLNAYSQKVATNFCTNKVATIVVIAVFILMSLLHWNYFVYSDNNYARFCGYTTAVPSLVIYESIVRLVFVLLPTILSIPLYIGLLVLFFVPAKNVTTAESPAGNHNENLERNVNQLILVMAPFHIAVSLCFYVNDDWYGFPAPLLLVVLLMRNLWQLLLPILEILIIKDYREGIKASCGGGTSDEKKKLLS